MNESASGGNVCPSFGLDIYGYRVQIRCCARDVLEGLADDFAFFRTEAAEATRVIELLEQDPPYTLMPPATATVYTPRNVSYRHGGQTLVDYSGRGLGIHEHETGNFRLYSRERDLLYEGAYLFLLSQCGEALDARRLHRVHALGVSVAGKAALVLLPMGGGKSTLGSELLRYPEVELLSDDSPLIDRSGDVHAFPLRLGLLPGSEAGIPPEQLRRINRMEFGPKVLVNYTYFAHRVRARAVPSMLLLGRRSLGSSCEVRPVSGRTAMRELLSNCVVGLGLFQGMEFVLQRSMGEIVGKTRTAWSRLRASMHLVQRSAAYEVILGRDIHENGRVLVEFMKAAAPNWRK